MALETPKLAQKKPPIMTCTGLTILFFVLLRIGIGWHLAYEGCWKLREDHWTAGGYLQESTGPLRPYFLKLVPDANAEVRLTEGSIVQRMNDRAARAADHYKLTDQQRKIFDEFLERKKKGLADELNVKAIFDSQDFQDKLADYRMAVAIREIGPEGNPPDGLEVTEGVTTCLNDLNVCREAIVKRFEPVLDDLDRQVKQGHGLALEGIKANLNAKIEDMKDDLKDAGPDVREQLQEQIAALDSNIAEMEKKIGEDMETVKKGLADDKLGDPEVRPAIMPDNLPELDDLHWLTPGHVNSLVERRYDLVLLPYCYFIHFTDYANKDRESRLATKDAGERYGELVALELVKTFEEYHQSKYGWRYRNQKLIGAYRDTVNVAYLFDEPAIPWAKKNASVSAGEGATAETRPAAETEKKSDIELAADIEELSDFEMARMDYFRIIEEIEAMERAGAATKEGGIFNQERLADLRSKASGARKALLTRLEVPYNDLDPARMETFTEEMFMDLDVDRQMRAGPVPREPEPWWYHYLINWGNMLGLMIAGVCLMLGLFTRLSALAGACLIALYYMCLPPWPWLPETPMAEGHYFFVNKNLIEIIALLMIASSRVGRWFGLDAIIHAILVGLRGSGRSRPQAAVAR